MRVHETDLPGVRLIEPDVFEDSRGLFSEAFHLERYRREAGIVEEFVQDNYSRSHKNVLRGLHFQRTRPQGKLVRVSYGKIFDVAVDIDPSSPTFARWVGFELDGSGLKQLWIPPGFAHGFCVLSDFADVHYKCTDFYDADDEAGLRWDCATVNVRWPVDAPRLSPKDATYPDLNGLLT